MELKGVMNNFQSHCPPAPQGKWLGQLAGWELGRVRVTPVHGAPRGYRRQSMKTSLPFELPPKANASNNFMKKINLGERYSKTKTLVYLSNAHLTISTFILPSS